MKTWQMIKELTENPEKEFISLDAYGDEMKAYIAEKFKDGNVSNSNVVVIEFEERTEIITLNGFMLKSKWAEVKKPVDFMTAFKAFRNMKTISVKCDGMKDAIFLGESNGHTMFHEEYIDNGKWYIEE